MSEILLNKHYEEESVFLPANLLREARRQKDKRACSVPEICLLDPDGDLANYLLKHRNATKDECWAFYHSHLYSFTLDDVQIGIPPALSVLPMQFLLLSNSLYPVVDYYLASLPPELSVSQIRRKDLFSSLMLLETRVQATTICRAPPV